MTWTITDEFSVPLRIGDITTTLPTIPVGSIVRGNDNFFGAGEFILVKTATTLAFGTIVVWDKDFLCVGVPNSTLQGRAVATLMASQAGANCWGWAQIAGNAVAIANATVAAGTLSGITAVGGSGTLATGKALLGAMTNTAQTATVVKTNVSTVNGSNVITVPGGADGWFFGVTMTGTGISGTITSINTNNREVTLSANASATGVITATATYTGFSVLSMNRPMAQGPIT